MVAYRALTPEIFVRLEFPQPNNYGGRTKKVNIKRLFKSSSCFLAVAFILVAALYIPVNAAGWTTLKLSDYVGNVYYDGNFRCARYSFDIEPFLVYRGSNYQTSGYGSLSIMNEVGTDGLPITYISYPLGQRQTGGPPLSNSSSGSIAIDISDFKDNAAITVESAIDVDFEIVYDSYQENITEQVQLAATWYLTGYASSGTYVGSIESVTTAQSIILQDVEEQFTYEVPFKLSMSLSEFSNSVQYVVPYCQLQIKVTENHGNIRWYRTTFRSDNFRIISRVDMLLESSLTMKKVEDQLASLNDKTDIIISGTPEQNTEANNKVNVVQGSNQDMDKILSDMDSMMDYDTSSSFNTIMNFLESPGWKDITGLLDPIIKWEYTGTMMLIAAAFATISIILFGR